MNVDIASLKEQLLVGFTQYGGKILLAILAFSVGRIVIGKLSKLLLSKMNSSHIDKDVQPFLISLITVGLNVMLLLSCAGILGIQTTSFVAVLGAAGLAVGLALQGSLANFAGGVLILIFKPYRVGDLISAAGFTGHVESIQIFNTVLVTPDNKTIILPNGQLATAPITNISGKGVIRVDMVFAAGNQNDLATLKKALSKAVNSCESALKDRAHDILLTKMTENALHFDVRVWTVSAKYWDTYYGMHEAVKAQFDAHQIQGPQIRLTINDLKI